MKKPIEVKKKLKKVMESDQRCGTICGWCYFIMARI